MKILITGGAGFVGSSLAVELKRKFPQSDVVAFDNLKRRGSELNLARFQTEGISFVHGDIRNPDDFSALEGRFDLFLECSAEPSVLAGLTGSPRYLIDTNLLGTVNCLEFARGRADAMVFLSTSRVYSMAPLKEIPLVDSEMRLEIAPQASGPGLSQNGISEAFPVLGPRSLYGATKLASEMLVQEYVESYGLKAWINRCGVIAGPGQFGKVDQGVFTLWVARHYFRKPLRYTGFGGAGKQVRDLLHPKDLFALIEQQWARPLPGAIFNVGGGRKISTSLLELTSLCREITGNVADITSDAATSSVDIPLYLSDCGKVTAEYGWVPARGVREIVTETHDWLKANEKALEPIFAR